MHLLGKGADTHSVETLKVGLEAGISRYGAGSEKPDLACAVLRARAMAHGLDLRTAAKIDLAAAAIGADAWMLLCNTNSFELPRQYGEAAVRSLAAILARSAGHSGGSSEFHSENCASAPELIVAAESHGRWAYRVIGEDAPTALRAAAFDLAAAGPKSRFSSYAELLSIVADSLEMPRVFR